MTSMDCILCNIVQGSIPARIIKETKHSVVLLDAFPLARGHVLVIPKNHHTMIQAMSSEENTDLFAAVHTMLPRLEETFTGATLVAIHNGSLAGQEIPHVHVHLVPRDHDDSAGPIHNMFSSRPKLSESEADQILDILTDKC